MMHKSVLEQNCILPPLTMKEVSCIKIMTMLCNNRKLKNLILKCNFHNADTSSKLCTRSGKEWEAVEAMVNEMLSKICKSDLLKKMLGYLWPLSYRMMLWKSTYAPTISNSFLRHFHWTSRGRIDHTRTVRCIIRNRNISVGERFVLACSVCLVNEIIGIWGELSREDKVYFHDEHRDRISPLTFFWAVILEPSGNYSPEYLDRALVCASEMGLLDAVKYLFEIAPRKELIYMPSSCSEQFITKLRSGELLEEDENDIEYFFFSQMTDEQQEGTFRCFTETALSFLLHSSKYKLCLKLLEERMKSSVRDIARALKMIFYTYHLEVVNDEDCRLLFMDFWRKIDPWMRRARIIKDLVSEFLFVLIRDNFPFILEKEAFRKIDELASLDLKSNIFDNPVDFHEGKWNLLLFIIKEVPTTPLVDLSNPKILFHSSESPSNVAAMNNVSRFIHKVLSQNPI